MRGTIGNITVVNLSQQLSVQTSPTQTNSGWANITDITTPEASGLFAATAGTSTSSPYGTLNSVATSSTSNLNLTSTGNKAVIIGNETAATGTVNEIVVIRV